MVNVCLLGATGSIGKQAISVINNLDGYNIVAMSCNTNTSLLKDLLTSTVRDISVGIKDDTIYPSNVNIHYGEEGLIELIKNKNVDVVINALVGGAGLICTVTAIKNHKKLLLANKESLVMGGDIINSLLKEYNGELYPIDSEHSALWQCLENVNKNNVSKLIITSSGGALRDKSREELKSVTINDVLAHPTWNMGGKITVDCATMVNKALEVMEAHFLFGFDYDDILTVLHRESKVHGAIRMKDGSTILEASETSMLLPIQYALTYPNRVESNVKDYKLEDTQSLTFKEMDFERYPMLKLGYEVAKMGGIMPTVYSTANEVAVSKFLNGEIKFLEIEDIITKAVNDFSKRNINNPTLDDIFNTIDLVKANY